MSAHSFLWRPHRAFVVVIALVVGLTLAVLGPAPPAGAAGGHKLWASRYERNKLVAEGQDIAVSPDGTMVYATGLAVRGMQRPDFLTVAYDATTGSEVWVDRYDGPAGGDDRANAIAVSPDGATVYVTGFSDGSGTDHDYATVAYDATTGAVIWVDRYNGPGNYVDQAAGLALSPDGGRLYVTGFSLGSGTYYDMATLAYDAATGARIWVNRYNGPQNSADEATAVAVSPDGARVFVAGEIDNGLFFHLGTVSLDAATGGVIWAHADVRGEEATSLAVSPDGAHVYVAGWGGGSPIGYLTISYDATTGAPVWKRFYKGPGAHQGEATSVAASPDGSMVFVTGGSPGLGEQTDVATLAYDAVTGAKVWGRRYDGPGHGYDVGSAIVVSPDGTRVYITGNSGGAGTETDCLTIAYDALTGARAWRHTYDGPISRTDSAHAIAVSSDGIRRVRDRLQPGLRALDRISHDLLWSGLIRGWSVTLRPLESAGVPAHAGTFGPSAAGTPIYSRSVDTEAHEDTVAPRYAADFISDLSREEFDGLVRHTAERSVSVYLPTWQVGPDAMQGRVRLKNLLALAEERLTGSGVRRPEAIRLLRPARRLVDDESLWRHQGDGLALFIAPNVFHHYRLPRRVADLVVVGDRFHILPLLPLFTDDGRFLVLALSENDARLFEGTRLSVHEVTVPGLPPGVKEALRLRSPPQGTWRARVRPRGTRNPRDQPRPGDRRGSAEGAARALSPRGRPGAERPARFGNGPAGACRRGRDPGEL